jgi:hypothetical protein
MTGFSSTGFQDPNLFNNNDKHISNCVSKDEVEDDGLLYIAKKNNIFIIMFNITATAFKYFFYTRNMIFFKHIHHLQI